MKEPIIDHVSLSTEERQCLSKIFSIQDYYHLQSHQKLIPIIISKKQSEQFLAGDKTMISNIFEADNKEQNYQDKIKIYAKKYTYEKLV